MHSFKCIKARFIFCIVNNHIIYLFVRIMRVFQIHTKTFLNLRDTRFFSVELV